MAKVERISVIVTEQQNNIMTIIFFLLGAIIVGFLANWLSNLFSKTKTHFSLWEKLVLGIASSVAGTLIGFLVGLPSLGFLGTVLVGVGLVWVYKTYIVKQG